MGTMLKQKKRFLRLGKGDYVRVSKMKGVFDKGYEQNFTTEIFIVGWVIKGAESSLIGSCK